MSRGAALELSNYWNETVATQNSWRSLEQHIFVGGFSRSFPLFARCGSGAARCDIAEGKRRPRRRRAREMGGDCRLCGIVDGFSAASGGASATGLVAVVRRRRAIGDGEPRQRAVDLLSRPAHAGNPHPQPLSWSCGVLDVLRQLFSGGHVVSWCRGRSRGDASIGEDASEPSGLFVENAGRSRPSDGGSTPPLLRHGTNRFSKMFQKDEAEIMCVNHDPRREPRRSPPIVACRVRGWRVGAESSDTSDAG